MSQRSRTLQTRIESMGFDSVVYHPVHPEALRLLLASALHRGREQRSQRRYPVGCEVRWRSGLRRHRATLTEISPRGCRLLIRAKRGPRDLQLLIPGDLASGAELLLPGRVARFQRRAADLAQLSVVFERLAPPDRRHLERLLRSVEVGPRSLAA